MRCPHCGKTTVWKGNPFRPFCSERCKLVDLDNWFSERYRIPSRPEHAAEDAGPVRDTRKSKGERG